MASRGCKSSRGVAVTSISDEDSKRASVSSRVEKSFTGESHTLCGQSLLLLVVSYTFSDIDFLKFRWSCSACVRCAIRIDCNFVCENPKCHTFRNVFKHKTAPSLCAALHRVHSCDHRLSGSCDCVAVDARYGSASQATQATAELYPVGGFRATFQW